MLAGSVNDTDPVTRPRAGSAAPAWKPPTIGGATTTGVKTEINEAAGAGATAAERTSGAAPATTGAAATGAEAPPPIIREPNNPASRSRNIPHANTPNPPNGPGGAVRLLTFNPSADNTVANNRTGRIAGATATFGA